MNITGNDITHGITRILHRYHIVLFSVFVLGALIVAIYLLNQILATSDQANGYTAQSSNASFDTATITKINHLRTVQDPSVPLNLPAGRINPFVEQ